MVKGIMNVPRAGSKSPDRRSIYGSTSSQRSRSPTKKQLASSDAVIDRVCEGNGPTVAPWNHSSKGAPRKLKKHFWEQYSKVSFCFEGVLRA